ncbi:DNA mismatch repair protein MutL [Peptoniphilus sp. ING2-D1G]|nr:DNA mismatch repair protein MutL [Peptoniphilus sp. ING2-D1G]
MSIKVLDDITISKIAAGEIIENPASIVKEMIENSIDAKAKHINIEISGETTDLIKIADNGVGMNSEDLKLAFLRHSTSKITSSDDLLNIKSLGFRGEALASISNISKIKVLTKDNSSEIGTKATVEKGIINSLENISMNTGTIFYIKDIFYNTPVRKNFLKSDNTEFNNIYDIVQKIALSNSDINIKLIRNDKIILNSIANNNKLNHIYSILGRDIASNLIPIEFTSSSYKIKGFISNNLLFRSNRSHQYIYINGRFVKNSEFSSVIENQYRSLIPLNRYPVFLLYIEIDPMLIDVNIHPTKSEVKISKDNNVLKIIENLVNKNLNLNRRISDIKESDDKKPENMNIFEIYDYSKETTKDNEIAKNNFEKSNHINSFYKTSNFLYEGEDDYRAVYKENNNFYKEEVNSKIDFNLLNSNIIGVIFSTYIILENSAEDTIYFIDQHAAHERILYEKYMRQYKDSNIYSQILLEPEILTLTPTQKDLVERNIELFKSIGFDISDFGESDIILRQYPVLFGKNLNKNFVYDIISSLDDISQSAYETDPYIIMKKACKAAVKAGDKLSHMEIESLIKQLINCENPYTCPHGRPTVVKKSKYNFEKMFLRE